MPRPGSPVRESFRDRRVRLALRRSWYVLALLALLVAGAVAWLNWPRKADRTHTTAISLPELRADVSEEIPSVTFTDVTAAAGIEFHHENGAYGDKLLPETMGGGCALFDYDADGDADLLLVNSTRWPWDQRAASERPATMALYRNDGDWTFTDVTRQTGLDVSFYGMGAAAGDMDNDGDRDLFISAVGVNHLFRNDDGHFVDVTRQAGVAGAEGAWSSGCAWLDYNNDSRLDLFVCNYIRWSKELDLAQHFTLDGTHRAYGPPLAFQGAHPYLYRNEGGGRFTDVSAAMGVQISNPATGVPMAKSLGIVPVDLDQDGWIDVVVANDTVQNFVFHNQSGKEFQEIGAMAGIAFDSLGQARGAMGIDAAHFRNDATLGVAVGNFANEMTALYTSLNDPLQFLDASIATGLGPPTRLELTFGLFFFDYDLDGRLDLLCANGHLEQDVHKVQQSQTYAQPPQLFWNASVEGNSEFVRVPADKCGHDLVKPMVGRGSAFADLDGDGDLDVLLTSSGGAPRLLRNDQQLGNHWIRFRLVGKRANRDAVGARIEVFSGDRVLPRTVIPTRSYLSQSEPVVTVGLGDSTNVARAVIHWPGSGTQTVISPQVDRTLVVEQAD